MGDSTSTLTTVIGVVVVEEELIMTISVGTVQTVHDELRPNVGA